MDLKIWREEKIKAYYALESTIKINFIIFLYNLILFGTEVIMSRHFCDFDKL